LKEKNDKLETQLRDLKQENADLKEKRSESKVNSEAISKLEEELAAKTKHAERII
jgi:hypothetical protein